MYLHCSHPNLIHNHTCEAHLKHIETNDLRPNGKSIVCTLYKGILLIILIEDNVTRAYVVVIVSDSVPDICFIGWVEAFVLEHDIVCYYYMHVC